MSKALPKQTVAQAFVLWRVPINMVISREMLLKNIDQDIEDSAEFGFLFSDYSRRASAERTLKFVLQKTAVRKKRVHHSERPY